jgi:hypothetical protein
MKKLGIIAISVVLCLGLALPAMAEVTVKGLITLDVYRVSTDDPSGVTNGEDTTQFAHYAPVNYLRADYVNGDKTYGGRIRIYYGRWNDDDSDLNLGGYNSGIYEMGGDGMIWWKVMPKLKLEMGMINQIVGGNIGPPTHLKGHDVIVLITYGNLHTSVRQGIAGFYTVNDMVSIEVGLYDPDDDSTDAIAGLGTGEELQIPRLDFAVPINYKVGGTSIFVQPKGSILMKSYDQVTSGDDSFNVTTIGFDGQVKFGAFTGMFELDITKNLAGGDNYVSGLLGPGYNAATGEIIDSDATLWWLGASYQINPKWAAAVFYGSQEEEQDTLKITGRMSYGLRVTYAVGPNFFIFPHIQFYNSGDTEVSGTTISEGRDRNQIGVNFYLLF